MKQKHIIIVEDEKDILEVIEYNLKQEGYIVSTSMDGKSGIAKIRREQPDLILLDIMLPELDGLEICRILKSEPVIKISDAILEFIVRRIRYSFWFDDIWLSGHGNGG